MLINKQFLCYYEGQQEEMYFKHFGELLNKFNQSIRIKFRKVSDIKNLEASSSNIPKLAIFDFDFDDKRFKHYASVCKNVRILYTNVNFDLWLLLHKVKFNKSVSNNCAYLDLVRDKYNLSKTEDIKSEKTIRKILNQIDIEDIKNAIKNANEIMNSKIDNDRKYIGNKFYYYDNPSMTIHTFFERILEEVNIN